MVPRTSIVDTGSPYCVGVTIDLKYWACLRSIYAGKHDTCQTASTLYKTWIYNFERVIKVYVGIKIINVFIYNYIVVLNIYLYYM